MNKDFINWLYSYHPGLMKKYELEYERYKARIKIKPCKKE